MIREVYAGSLRQKAYTCGLEEKKARMSYTRTFTEVKARKCWKTNFWSMVFGPWYFGIGPWYLVQRIDPRYWVQGIGPTWFWTMVLREA